VLEGIARSFHFENLKRAVEQFSKGEKLLPLISFLKEGKIYELTKANTNVETVLRIIEKETEPDAVNLTLMAPSQAPPTKGDGDDSSLAHKNLLFAMTFDHLGGRWVSLFDVRKEGSSVELSDATPNRLESSRVSIHTNPEGDLDIRIDPMPLKT
jgi:hypothetical protein